MPKLIGITGVKGSGKGTAALGVHGWAEGRRLTARDQGFADKLKLSVARLFWPDINLEDALKFCNTWKNEEEPKLYLGYPPRKGDAGSMFSPEPYDIPAEWSAMLTGREVLQRYGTETHRDVFGVNFWVDQLLPRGHWDGRGQEPAWWEKWTLDETGEVAEFCVIQDLRFPNEADRIKELGGVIWEVQRPSLHAIDTHISEVPLDRSYIDKVIVNDGTVKDLLVNVHSELTSDYHMKYMKRREEGLD